MVQSVELVLDVALDDAVRREWDLLLQADLPSQARHRGPTNAPHVTFGVADALTDAEEAALADVPLPTTVRLGGLLVFPGRRAVLSRAVVMTPDLTRAHEDVARALEGCPGRPETTLLGRWTPHVTLARRLTPPELSRAVEVLADVPRELVGSPAALRRWDGDAKLAWDVVTADASSPKGRPLSAPEDQE